MIPKQWPNSCAPVLQTPSSHVVDGDGDGQARRAERAACMGDASSPNGAFFGGHPSCLHKRLMYVSHCEAGQACCMSKAIDSSRHGLYLAVDTHAILLPP